jgi:hypothetical protein
MDNEAMREFFSSEYFAFLCQSFYRLLRTDHLGLLQYAKQWQMYQVDSVLPYLKKRTRQDEMALRNEKVLLKSWLHAFVFDNVIMN